MDIVYESVIRLLYESLSEYEDRDQRKHIINKLLRIQYKYYKDIPNNDNKIEVYCKWNQSIYDAVPLTGIKYNSCFIVEGIGDYFILDMKTTRPIKRYKTIDICKEYMDKVCK